MPETFTEQEVLQYIRDRCNETSQAKEALRVGVSLGQLNHVLNGKFGLTKEMAAKFGFIEQERKFIQKVEEVAHE